MQVSCAWVSISKYTDYYGIHVLFSPVCLCFSSATDLINNLLQVKMRKRYSVDKSLSHSYLQVR